MIGESSVLGGRTPAFSKIKSGGNFSACAIFVSVSFPAFRSPEIMRDICAVVIEQALAKSDWDMFRFSSSLNNQVPNLSIGNVILPYR